MFLTHKIQAAVNLINLLDLAKKFDPKLVATRQRAVSFLKQHYLTDDIVAVEKVK